MKRPLILTASLLLFAQIVLGQCVANAGSDKIICVPWQGMDTVILGGSPSVYGGVQPYTFSWSTTVPLGLFGLTASDFLSDTTVENPTILSVHDEPISFDLTVTDSLGNSCSDEVLIQFSTFTSHLGTFTFEVEPGDTITWQNGNVSGGIPPLEYLWTPNSGLIDSTNQGFVAAPDSSTVYGITITDSAGCVVEGSPFIYVNVNPLSVNQTLMAPIYVFPNPTSGRLVFKLGYSGSTKMIQVFNAAGRKVFESRSDSESANMDVSGLPKGMYMYVISLGNSIHQTGQFIIQNN